MKKEKVKGRKLNRKKEVLAITAIVAFIIICCILYSIIKLFIEPTGVFAIENGKIYDEETAIGYIIREETVIYGENNTNDIVAIKNENQKVAKGDAVFRYSSNNEAKLKEKIEGLDKDIQAAIEGQNASIYSTDIQMLEKQIDEKLALIITLNDRDVINEYKNDISSLMIKKAKIAGELSPSGSYINKLINQRSEYEEQLNSGQTYINAPISGLVSYKIDGYEDALRADSVTEITKADLENVKIKTGQLISASSEQGKIVNNFYCYISTVLSSDNAMNVKVGSSVKIRLSNNEEIPAQVYNVSDFVDGEAVVTFKVTKAVEYLINYRKITMEIIWWDASGLKVPNSSIIYENEKAYVIRNRIGYTDKILVKVDKQNKNYAIIKNYTTQELRDMGYTSSEISSMKNISLYDEIVLKPKIKENNEGKKD